MDDLLMFLLGIAACGVLVLPVVLHIWHLRNARRLREQLEVLARRVAKLEGTTTAVAESIAAAPAATMPVPIPPVAAGIPVAPSPAPQAPVAAQQRSSLENVIGVKLFAWMGGLALFIGVVLAVSYAFQNNLITPGMRVIGGGLVGIALIAAGFIAARRQFHTPAFSMCATGVLVLYGDIYAAHAFYNILPLWLAFALMSAVSVAAFFLALRLDAQVIVVLGMLGGFLTPTLLWTGANRPLQLFGYAALLNVGVAAVAIRKRWNSLVLLAVLGTVVTEFAWLAQFYDADTASTARFVFLFFGLEFLLICFARQRLEPSEDWSALAAGFALNAGIIAAFSFVYSSDSRVHSGGFVLPFIFLCVAGVLALALSRQFARGGMSREWIAAVALAFTWAVEEAWLEEHFTASSAFAPVVWYVAIFALFVAYPYFAGAAAKWPWTISSVAGVLQFWLVYRVVADAYRPAAIGLLPLAFALPFAAGVWFLNRSRDVPLNSSDGRMASQAGAALIFLSLVFPVQFRGEWITVGWAIEGVALLMLYRRMPNARLPITAIVVLCAAFVRLAFNPAVLEYHPRTGVPIWNWYLYGYGITAACLLISGRLLRTIETDAWWRGAARFLYGLGVTTAFLLLNIEIADYFSVGPTLTFSFSGNFARDMTYSIAWALFAFALLLAGMRGNAKAVRYAGLALLIITLLKLFLHDLGNLSQLYRIGAFLGVAFILIVASFVYQRFLRPAGGEQRNVS